MLRPPSLILTALFIAACWCSATPCAFAAEPYGIKDYGRLFSTEAKKQAREAIQDIKKKYATSILIETKARKGIFARWLKDRPHNPVANELYVRIGQDAAQGEVVIQAGPQVNFLPSDQQELVAVLKKHFQEKNYDEVLRAGVDFIGHRLDENMGGPIPPPPSFDWMAVMWVILPMLAFWGLCELVRALPVARSQASESSTHVHNPAGGSYLAALFSSLDAHQLGQLFCIPRPAEPQHTDVSLARVVQQPAGGGQIDSDQGLLSSADPYAHRLKDEVPPADDPVAVSRSKETDIQVPDTEVPGRTHGES